jgi:hypothetical protein
MDRYGERAACAARKSFIVDAARLDSEWDSPKNRRYFPNFALQTWFFLDFSTISPTVRGSIA